MLGSPALRLLLLLKLRGGLRSQFRKLNRPRNWLFLGMGVLIFVPWILSLVFSSLRQPHQSLDFQLSEPLLGLVLMGLVVVTGLGAFQHRGLYLPKEEIELAFSAPISRADLARYRMLTNCLRSILGGLFIGVGFSRRLPDPLFGFVMAMVIALTLPLISQLCSLLLGSAENKFAKRMQGAPLRIVFGLLLALVLAPLMMFLFGSDFSKALLNADVSRYLTHPLVGILCFPVQAHVHAMHAASWGQFLPWLALCVLIWFVLFEATARVRVDFRELSLATSAAFAARIARLRKGKGPVGAGEVDQRTAGWNVPWWFGQGPFGALIWLKSVGILRKARGTLVFALIVMLFLVAFFAWRARGEGPEKLLLSSITVAMVGSLYLSAGLRFDFRQDTELMGEIKTWPLASWRIFLATILPQVLLISALLWLGLGLGALVSGFTPSMLLVLLVQPFVTMLWVALDNAAHLLAPVRYTPGQEGALQNVGRTVLLMFARMILLAILLACVAVPGGGAWLLVSGLEWPEWIAWVIGIGGGLLILMGFVVGLVVLGGQFLQRFDVARDRG